MQEHGIPFPQNESSSGIFVRWGKNCRYWLVGVFDGYKFGDFVTGTEVTAFPEKSRSCKHGTRKKTDTTKETEQIQNEQWLEAADKANRMWLSAQPCYEHEYLKKKNVPSIGLRVIHKGDNIYSYINNNTTNNIYNNDNNIINNNISVPLNVLVIPLYSSDNNIVSLQYIYPNGDKRFLKGGRKSGCYFPLGSLKRRILLAEGYATACSVFLATGELTICCFDAGNLKPVAEKFRKYYPTTEIIICADNDNVGLSKAIEAGKAIDAVTVFPVFSYGFNNLSDFNDLANAQGMTTVKRQIIRAFKR